MIVDECRGWPRRDDDGDLPHGQQLEPKATAARCADWQALIRTAEVVAGELEGRPVELTDDTATWLTLTMPPAVIEREAIAGVAAATAALSREICALCGGQGDPGPAHRQLAEHALQGLPNGRPAGSAWTPAGPGAASRPPRP